MTTFSRACRNRLRNQPDSARPAHRRLPLFECLEPRLVLAMGSLAGVVLNNLNGHAMSGLPPVAKNDFYSVNENTVLTAANPLATALTMISQPGDYVGQGKSYSFTTADGPFTASTNGTGVSIAFHSLSSSEWWQLDFAAPNGARLTAGTYNGAALYGFEAANQPGLSVFGDSRGSHTLTGHFTVTEAFYAASGNVVAFAASFVQHNEGDTPALSGTITYQDQAASGPPRGVLANDSDPSGLPLTAQVVKGPSHGALALSADGTFTYTPATNYFGPDSFTYVANDGQLTSSPAKVNITVNHVSPPPVAVADSFSTNEDTKLTVGAPGVLANDSQADGNALRPVLKYGPLHGTLQLNDDGSLTYMPNLHYSGPDSFEYYATDGKLDSPAVTDTITVNYVNYPPVATNSSYTVTEDGSLTTVAPLTALSVHSDPGDWIGGGGTYNYGAHDGTYRASRNDHNGVKVQFVPTADSEYSWFMDFAAPNQATLTPGTYNGAVRFPFEAAGQPGLSVDFWYRGSNTLTGTFTVYEANYDAQGNVISFDASFLMHNDGMPPALSGHIDYRAFAGQPGVLFNDTDVENEPLTAKLVTGPSHGTLALNPNGAFIYTPAPLFFGTDSFTYQANDGAGVSNVATATINVTRLPTAGVTGQLNPQSDTGESNTDGITMDNRPNFFGTAPAGSTVQLFATALDPAVPALIGQATAGASGQWSINSTPLADGAYAITVLATAQTGPVASIQLLPSGAHGPLVIDTIGPRVIGLTADPKTGRILVEFQDERSGMDQTTLLDPVNYRIDTPFRHVPAVLTGVTTLQPPLPTNPQLVTVALNGGIRLKHARYVITIFSGGIRDVAGNPLNGHFTGAFPSGGTPADSNFVVLLTTNGFKVYPLQVFVPPAKRIHMPAHHNSSPQPPRPAIHFHRAAASAPSGWHLSRHTAGR